MEQSQNMLPFARSFERNEVFNWQINSRTGISCDYANELGITILFMIQTSVEFCKAENVPTKTEDYKESLLSFIERMRMLPNYSAFMREKVDSSNERTSATKQYKISDFICDENIWNVRALEELAGKIREAAQPSDDIEADLSKILGLVTEATVVIYGEPRGMSSDEIRYFVELFCKTGLQVR